MKLASSETFGVSAVSELQLPPSVLLPDLPFSNSLASRFPPVSHPPVSHPPVSQDPVAVHPGVTLSFAQLELDSPVPQPESLNVDVLLLSVVDLPDSQLKFPKLVVASDDRPFELGRFVMDCPDQADDALFLLAKEFRTPPPFDGGFPHLFIPPGRAVVFEAVTNIFRCGEVPLCLSWVFVF